MLLVGVRTVLTRLELILQIDRPEHRIARARSSTRQQPALLPGFWLRQCCRGLHEQSTRSNTGFPLAVSAWRRAPGSLGGHDSAAGLNNDNAGSRDRIQPDNPAAIERNIKSAIARIGDGIEVRRNRMTGEGAGREIPKPVVPVKSVENTRSADAEAGSGLPRERRPCP